MEGHCFGDKDKNDHGNGNAEAMHVDFLPHRRARLVSSTKAMPVSQSPDSVMAFKDGTAANEGRTASVSGTPTCGVIGIQPASSSSLPLHPSLSSAPSTHSSTKRSTNAVFNPYIKVTPSTSTIAVVDRKLRMRKQFADKYRMQAVQQYANCSGRQHDAAAQHSISYRVGLEAVASPISAWNMHCATQQWRHSWRDSNLATWRQNQQILSNDMPLRPRLFLIRSRNGAKIAASKEHDQSARYQTSTIDRPMSHSQQQHMHEEGIWELGNGITEISGEGGSGKSQICLSLCVTCAMMPPLYPNNSEAGFGNQSTRDQNIQHYYTALYISMGEGVRSITIARRLEQIVQARLNRTYPNNQVKQLLSRIGLISLRNEEEFIDFVDHDLPNILSDQRHHHHHQQRQKQHQHQHRQQQQQSTKIALIVFDGIAGFFRFSDPLFQQFQKNNSTFHQQRGARLLHISSQLRRLSDLNDVPILITNQVTASIPPNDTPSLSMNTDEQQVVPALGLAWSNCVTTRYILQRKNEMTVSNEKCRNEDNTILAKNNNRWMRVRLARVLQSVNVPTEREVRFVIETGGVVAVT